MSPDRLILADLVAPLLALAAVSMTVAISAKVSDAQVPADIGVLGLPVLLLLFGPTVGLSVRGVGSTLAITGLLALVADGLLALAMLGFQRETILIRWW